MKHEEPPITIAMPIYNNPELTAAVLGTIQTKHRHIILLIDNGSNEDTKNMLTYQLAKPYHHLITLPRNLGVAKAWNTAIYEAQHRYYSRRLVLLNNDAFLRPETIDIMLETMECELATLCTAKNINDGSGDLDTLAKHQREQCEVINDEPDFSCFALNLAMLASLRSHESHIEPYPGLFDTNFYPAYFEDNDFHRRLKLAGLKAIKTNQAIFYHYKSSTLLNNPEIDALIQQRYFRNEQYYIHKWGGVPGKETRDQPLTARV